jgi:cation:H+ antiporter
MSTLFLLLIGFLLLYYGGEILVKSSVAISLKIRVSSLVIGMTVVAFATSLPELFVSIQALFKGSSDIALGNVIGSNIANIALVLGISSLFYSFSISKQTYKIDFPVMFASSVLFGIVLYFFQAITFFIGCFFVVSLFLFCYFLIKWSRNNTSNLSDDLSLTEQEDQSSIYKSVFLLFLSVFMLKFGADNIVDAAILISKSLGISERVIAVTVVAVGTSIPELATSLVAALRKENNLAVGNLIGSNIFNILAVIGFSSLIKKIEIVDKSILSFDYVFMMIITIVLAILLYSFSKKKIYRKEGLILLFLYITYIYINLQGI